MKKNDLIKTEDGIYRILSIEANRVLAIDCIKKTMPKFYIHSWSSYLQDRPNEIVSAAAKAETACDLIMECLREMELEEQKVMNENIEEER